MSIRSTVCLFVLALAPLGASSSAPPRHGNDGPAPPPRWFETHMEFMTRGGGRFITSNAPYHSDAEPLDQYGLEWSYGLGRKSLTGRLFGLADGKERATFWEFRTFWDPASKQVRVLQFGADGTVGEGWLAESETEGVLASEQVFTSPEGGARRVRHESRDDVDAHATKSFKRAGDAWVADRDYTWHRTPRKR